MLAVGVALDNNVAGCAGSGCPVSFVNVMVLLLAICGALGSSAFWYHFARLSTFPVLTLGMDDSNTMRLNLFGALPSKLAGLNSARLELRRCSRDFFAWRNLLEIVDRDALSS